jgi:hypothetical protein
MKKILPVLIGLLLIGTVIGIASVTALPTATYIIPNKINYNIGEEVIVTSNGGYDALETPNGVLSHVSNNWDGHKLVMIWKAEKSGTVKFYTENTSVLIKVGIDKPTPMQQFMKILGFGQKD